VVFSRAFLHPESIPTSPVSSGGDYRQTCRPWWPKQSKSRTHCRRVDLVEKRVSPSIETDELPVVPMGKTVKRLTKNPDFSGPACGAAVRSQVRTDTPQTDFSPTRGLAPGTQWCLVHDFIATSSTRPSTFGLNQQSTQTATVSRSSGARYCGTGDVVRPTQSTAAGDARYSCDQVGSWAPRPSA
jgi:hypothetical protein